MKEKNWEKDEDFSYSLFILTLRFNVRWHMKGGFVMFSL